MELSRELLNKLANSRMGRPQVKPPLHASSGPLRPAVRGPTYFVSWQRLSRHVLREHEPEKWNQLSAKFKNDVKSAKR
ncbi:hypothetical protein Unana1_02904 [Umbelopsis nana]